MTKTFLSSDDVKRNIQFDKLQRAKHICCACARSLSPEGERAGYGTVVLRHAKLTNCCVQCAEDFV